MTGNWTFGPVENILSGEIRSFRLAGDLPATVSTMAISLPLDEDLQNRLRDLAGAKRQPAERLMLEAVREYVEREEARQSFAQEALASWAAYRETGRHLSAQELRDWLDRWGTDAPAEPPECHD